MTEPATLNFRRLEKRLIERDMVFPLEYRQYIIDEICSILDFLGDKILVNSKIPEIYDTWNKTMQMADELINEEEYSKDFFEFYHVKNYCALFGYDIINSLIYYTVQLDWENNQAMRN